VGQGWLLRIGTLEIMGWPSAGMTRPRCGTGEEMHNLPPVSSGAPSQTQRRKRPVLIRSLLDWWLTVETHDPIRTRLNRGFFGFLSITVLFTVGLALVGDYTLGQRVIWFSSAALFVACAWPTRRGSTIGVVVVVILSALIIGLFFDPTSYAGPYPTVHVIFLLPIAIAALFITPSAGILSILLQMSILTGVLLWRDWDRAQTVAFVIFGTFDLGAMTALLIGGASLLKNALRDSIAANTALRTLNVELEQRVADRTARLVEANAFIERRAAERACQVAAVIHDLRNKGTGVDSALAMMQLDIEDFQNDVRPDVEDIAAATVKVDICRKQKDIALIQPAEKSEKGMAPDDDGWQVAALATSAANKVISAMHMLLRQITTADQQIQGAMGYLRGLLSDMLDMAILEADSMQLHPTATDLRIILDKLAISLLPELAMKQCTLTIADGGPAVAWCDPARIDRVLYNVLDNAIKYTSAYRANGSGQVAVSLAQEGAEIICRVADNGPGIAAADLARLGERFRRAEQSTAGARGTGLGLHFCKGVIQASSGRMLLESAGVGQGLTVDVRLPVLATLREAQNNAQPVEEEHP
jgi:signal transduction histidine kinase